MTSRQNLDNLLSNPIKSWEIFHQSSKLKKLSIISKAELLYSIKKNKYFKAYVRFKEFFLPKINQLSAIPKDQNPIINNNYPRSKKNCQLPLRKLSVLLQRSVGLVNIDNSKYKRAYTSTGKIYSLEIYLIPLKTSLPIGLYHYYIPNHSLEELLLLNISELKAYIPNLSFKNISCVIFITDVFNRSTVLYGDRGYRYSLVEAGQVAQNFYIYSNALNHQIRIIDQFIDDNVNKLLDIDGRSESVISILAIE